MPLPGNDGEGGREGSLLKSRTARSGGRAGKEEGASKETSPANPDARFNNPVLEVVLSFQLDYIIMPLQKYSLSKFFMLGEFL